MESDEGLDGWKDLEGQDHQREGSARADWHFLNLDYLQEISPDNYAFFQQMMVLFKAESSLFIDKVNGHLMERDFISICKTAHAMKPMGSYIGVVHFTALVASLEKVSGNADVAGIVSIFQKITEMITAINLEIDQYLDISK